MFVSGIGCAARFPYYVSTYGFHTIHGRAPAVATGVKLANPELDVWVITGDGDGLSIGGNHMLHVLRRNVDLQLVLFNNEIYGLTKGQYSPTSRRGTRSPSTPLGLAGQPGVARRLCAGRGRPVRGPLDRHPACRTWSRCSTGRTAQGASFVEVFQNCVVFNDGVFDDFTEKSVAADRQILVEHGKPLLFGAKKTKGLRIKPGRLALEAVTIGEGGVTADDILVHDETDRILATMLTGLEPPEFPVAIGVLYCNPATPYETEVHAQLAAARTGQAEPSLDALLRKGATWTVGD